MKSFIIWMRNYFFLKNYVTSEEAVSQNVFYYACYQVSFKANHYFELVTIVSSAFKNIAESLIS